MEPFVLPANVSDRIRMLNRRLCENWDYATYEQLDRCLRTGGYHGIAEAIDRGMILACTHIADGVYGWCLIPSPTWNVKPVSADYPELVKGSWRIGKKIVTQKFQNSPLFIKIRYSSKAILTLSEQEWSDLHSLGRRNMEPYEAPADEDNPYDGLPTPETDPLAGMSQGEIDQLADEIFNDGAPNG